MSRCVHYWEIEPANGPTSEGVCSVCGGTRTFYNYTREPDTWKPRSKEPEDVDADPPATQVKTVEPG